MLPLVIPPAAKLAAAVIAPLVIAQAWPRPIHIEITF